MDKKRGGQIGNNNGGKNKLWSLAIQKAIRKRSKSEQLEELENIAEVLLNKCMEGDMVALKELGDRIEGKPMQSVEMSVHRSQSDMDDSELTRVIAEDSSSRTTRKTSSEKEPNSVH